MAGERARIAAEVMIRAAGVIRASFSPETAREAALRSVAERLNGRLDKPLVQASVGLRYLALMRERLRLADYEDVPRLRAETGWLEGYLAVRLRSEWVVAAREASPGGKLPGVDAFYAAVAARIVADLEAAALAA